MGTKASGEVCGECGGRTYLIERRGDRAHARVCTCSARCGLCEGRGYAYEVREETFSAKVGPKRYEVLVPCVCQHRAKRMDHFNQVGLPAVVSHASFENYRPGIEEQERARSIARDFAYRFNKSGANKGFILSGPVGTGKTHLMAASLSHLVLEVGIEARYVEISLLYATIRRGFQEGKSGGEIISPLSEVEVLAIDELGKGRGSQFEMDTLDELISRRYNGGRTTLFATNYSLEPDRKGGRSPTGYRSTEDAKNAVREMELLRERVGERIYSRLCEMCTFVEIPRGERELDHRRNRQQGAEPLPDQPISGTRKGR
ncbi:MAG TPA: ATP-binding protein [Archangium sp.]|nr:ATP-binding protein [Archangium sp.]